MELHSDMPFVTNFTQIKYQNNFLPKKTRDLQQATFFNRVNFFFLHIINVYTQGYITLNKYIIGIASIGLPKVNLWTTKCVTKRP